MLFIYFVYVGLGSKSHPSHYQISKWVV